MKKTEKKAATKTKAPMMAKTPKNGAAPKGKFPFQLFTKKKKAK